MTSTSPTEAPGATARAFPGLVAVLLIGAAVLVVGLTAGLLVGGRALPPDVVLSALRDVATDEVHAVVFDTRMPRTVAALVAGIGLGVAGSLLQTLTRNPLADAGLLGANAGAALAVAAGSVLASAIGVVGQATLALVGALAATALVSLVGLRTQQGDPTRLILAGIALSAVLLGATNALILIDPDAFERMRHWQTGSVAMRELADVLPGGMLIVFAIVLVLLLSPALEIGRLGDDVARALGVRLGAVRALAVVAVAAASGGATAIAGPIAFVGLIGAHLARGAVGRLRAPTSAVHIVAGLIGGGLVVAADVAGRVLLWPGELPAGLLATAIGAPILLWLIRRRPRVRA